MSTPQSLRDEIGAHRRRLDDCLQSRYHMSYRTFKTIKAVTQLVGMAAGVYAMRLGADPGLALILMALIWGGPEAVEAALDNQSE